MTVEQNPRFPVPVASQEATEAPPGWPSNPETLSGRLSGLSITVYGTPKPKGSLRHVGHGRLKEQLEGSPVWREAVKTAAYAAGRDAGWDRLDGVPVVIEATLTFEKPASAPKRRETWPVTRSSGDIDKQARNLCDALVDAGVLKDDSQIVDLLVRKRYAGQHPDALHIPGAVIRIRPLDGEVGAP